MDQPAGQFHFPCVFLTGSLLSVFISKVKNNLLGGLVAPSFSHFQNFATQNAPKYRKIKGLLGGAEVCPPNSSNLAKSTTFSEMPLTSGFLAHVPRCDRPCCPVPAGLGKMYHEPSISAHCPDVKWRYYSKIRKIRRVEKCAG